MCARHDPGTLAVSGLFGPTFQGEGSSCGQRAIFVRLSGCNLDCSWCDTPYTWDWNRFTRADETTYMTTIDVANWILDQDASLVVVTGGEPLLQQRRLVTMTGRLSSANRRVEVETNGTIRPSAELTATVTQFNVSPKLNGSGVSENRAVRPEVLRALADTGKAMFKFVIANDDDIADLVALQRQLGLSPVWVMPEGTRPDEVITRTRQLVEPATTHGWNLTTRLHVLLWGDQRGR